MSNDNLINAKKAKNDEFYTQLSDIEKELSHYPIETFKDKVVYCPCDSTDYSNGYISNFAIYFYKNFKSLGLKKLICTCYSDGINYYEYNGINEFESHRDNGDFRSEYCTNLLAEADIVVTNPPFSLFREFVKWLVDADKKFIVLGNSNAVTYKEVFKLIQEGKLWWGNTMNGGGQHWFLLPNNLDYNTGKIETRQDGHRYAMIGTVAWWTNCDFGKRHDKIIGLNKEDYESNGVVYYRYDNYNAIDVPRCNKIPMDYDGFMGVPTTYLGIHNTDQFEIVGISGSLAESFRDENGKLCSGRFYINGKRIYDRIVIRHRKDENDLSSDT